AIDPDEGVRRIARSLPDLDPSVCAHLVHLYGSLADEVLAYAVADPDLLRPLHREGPDLAAQAVYARDVEWACRPEDVLQRRTTLALRGLAGENVAEPVAELSARPHALDRAEEREVLDLEVSSAVKRDFRNQPRPSWDRATLYLPSVRERIPR